MCDLPVALIRWKERERLNSKDEAKRIGETGMACDRTRRTANES